jgi:hypothetical protein
MSLPWGYTRNLENSLCEYLNTELVSDEIKDKNGVQILARIGRKEDNDWQLPVITLYADTKQSPHLFVGNTETFDTDLIIIDIFATSNGERSDLADWVKDKVKGGFTYYTYTPSAETPDSPTKVAGRLLSVEFISNAKVKLGQNVPVEDQHRHRISINVDKNGS